MSSVTKTKQDNDVTDHIGVVYIESNIELSSLIESGIDCDESHIG